MKYEEQRRCPSCGNTLTLKEIESVKLFSPACPVCNNRYLHQYIKVDLPKSKVLG